MRNFEGLKEFARNQIEFEPTDSDFERALSEIMYNAFSITSDAEKFIAISPADVLELAAMDNRSYNASNMTLENICRSAYDALVYNYMYSEFKTTFEKMLTKQEVE